MFCLCQLPKITSRKRLFGLTRVGLSSLVVLSLFACYYYFTLASVQPEYATIFRFAIFLFRRRTEFFVNLRFKIDRCKIKVCNFEFSIVGKQLHFVTWQKGHAFLSAVQVQIGCSILHPFKCPHHMRTGERFLSNFPYQVLDQRICRPKNLELKSWKVCLILEWNFGEGGDPSSSQVSFLNWKCLSWRAALWPQGVAQWHFGHALEIVQEKDIFFCNDCFSNFLWLPKRVSRWLAG